MDGTNGQNGMAIVAMVFNLEADLVKILRLPHALVRVSKKGNAEAKLAVLNGMTGVSSVCVSMGFKLEVEPVNNIRDQ